MSVDSVSGSLLRSEPVSPMSPGSPDPGGRLGASATDIKQALNSLQTSASNRALSPPVKGMNDKFL